MIARSEGLEGGFKLIKNYKIDPLKSSVLKSGNLNQITLLLTGTRFRFKYSFNCKITV